MVLHSNSFLGLKELLSADSINEDCSYFFATQRNVIDRPAIMKWQCTSLWAPFLFILCVECSSNNEKDKREIQSSKQHPPEWQQLWYSNIEEFQKLIEPIFDNNTITNMTVQLGGTAFLHCRVRNLGERTISWVRRRDWHILTFGLLTYTNDERFQMLHAEGSEDWTLQIKYVQQRDNGTYECQVATGSGIMSHFVNLNIVVPEAFILGGPGDHHVDIGSPIHLICVIEKSPQPPQYVLWYHNSNMINYDTARGGITVETEPSPRTQSKLTIMDATEADSGNYTCSAPNTLSASILVFVSEGDKMAAISRRKSSTGSGAEVLADVMLWFVLLPLITLTVR